MRRLLPLILLPMLAAACGRDNVPMPAATGPAPATTTAPAAGTPRIVSTVPAATLNLVLLGAVDSLVGVSTFDVVFLPENKRSLPVVGDYDRMNYERLIGLNPTALIIQTTEAHIPARLRELSAAHHFAIINIKLDTSADLWATVKALGHAAGKDDAAATAILKARGELKEITASLEGKPRPKVVYVIGKEPLLVVGANNFMDEMLTMAGGKNAAAAIGNSFIPISNETLVKMAPDVLLISAPGQTEQTENDERLETWTRLPLPAVKNNRVFLVTGDTALTASIDLPHNVRTLAALIHKGEAASPATSGVGRQP